jgi:hypothetical protein
MMSIDHIHSFPLKKDGLLLNVAYELSKLAHLEPLPQPVIAFIDAIDDLSEQWHAVRAERSAFSPRTQTPGGTRTTTNRPLNLAVDHRDKTATVEDNGNTEIVIRNQPARIRVESRERLNSEKLI